MSGGFAYKQDLPPQGGYAPIRYKRNLPARGPGGLVVFGSVIGICAYGFYKVGQGNLEKRELKRERAWSRIHLVPLLMAEADRETYRANQALLNRERAIMKDVPDWEVSLEEAGETGETGVASLDATYCEDQSTDTSELDRTLQVGKSVYNTKRYTPATFVVV